MRRRARVDANHSEIVEVLRRAGWTVIDTSRLGAGFPDAVAAKHGRVELIEIKDGAKPPSDRKLTTAEAKLHALLAGADVQVRIVATVEEAARL